MNLVLYENHFSSPLSQTINHIKALPSKTYQLILLLGMNDNPKTEFYKKLIKSPQKNPAAKLSQLTKNNFQTYDEAQIPSTTQTGAELFIDSENIIWCNTEDLSNPNSSSDKVYIQNIVQYCSKIVFFVEFTGLKDARECQNHLKNMIDSRIERDLSVIICINIVNPNINLNSIKKAFDNIFFACLAERLKLFQKHFIEYSDLDVNSVEYLNSFKSLKQLASENLTNLPCSVFFKTFEKPEEIKNIQMVESYSSRNLTQEEKINKLLGLDKKQSEKHNYKNTETDSNYYREKEKNYINFLNSNCHSSTSLQSWKTDKLSEIDDEMKIIEETYKRRRFSLIESEFNTFLIQKYPKKSGAADNFNHILNQFKQFAEIDYVSQDENFLINQLIRKYFNESEFNNDSRLSFAESQAKSKNPTPYKSDLNCKVFKSK